MENKRITLISLYLLKERVHWTRMQIGFRHFKGFLGKLIGGGLLLILTTIFHYIFAVPHFIFECFMWLFVREQFILNMVNLTENANNKLKEFELIKNPPVKTGKNKQSVKYGKKNQQKKNGKIS